VTAVVLLAAPTDLAGALQDSQRRERAVRAVQAVATASAAVGARRLLAVTSAMVLGADPDNPVPLPDDAPVAAAPDAGIVGDLLEVEHILARTPRVHPGLSVTVLRPAALVGPDVDTVVSRHFEAPRLLKVKECENAWQFCHFDDVASAVVTALTQELDGALTVGSEGTLDQERLERLTGMRRIELPASLALGTAQRLHRIGVLPTPASDLAFVAYPWAVSAERLLAAGWTPSYDNETCLGVLLEQVRGRHAVAARRLDRKEAALGAAGAAVALVGTAALMRRRRKRGSGS
jgi:nucleoside-diphosphate-sugar epimerase